MALAGLGGMLSWPARRKARDQAGRGAPAGPELRRRAPAARPTIAVFNMAAVMREFGQAKYQVHMLNEKRKSLSTQAGRLAGRVRQVSGRVAQAAGARDPR